MLVGPPGKSAEINCVDCACFHGGSENRGKVTETIPFTFFGSVGSSPIWLSSSFVLLRCPSPILHVTKDEMIASACTHHSMRMADLFDADVPLGLSGHAAWYMYELPMAAHGFLAYCFEIYIVVAADLGADLEWLRHRSTLPGSWAWRASSTTRQSPSAGYRQRWCRSPRHNILLTFHVAAQVVVVGVGLAPAPTTQLVHSRRRQ